VAEQCPAQIARGVVDDQCLRSRLGGEPYRVD
jgi:hypothetical protein